MEYTMQVLCCILFSVFIILNLGFFVRLVLDTINDRMAAQLTASRRPLFLTWPPTWCVCVLRSISA